MSVFSSANFGQLLREAQSRAIHRSEDIEIWLLEPGFLDELEARMDRSVKFELTRNDGELYVNVNGVAFQGRITKRSLAEASGRPS